MKLIAILCAFISSVAPVVAVTCDAGFLVSGEDCVACSPGKYQLTVDDVICEDCAIGKFSPHGAAACRDCSKGRYAPKKGTKSCKYCEAGKFSAFTGQAGQCVETCKAGTYGPQGHNECIRCSANSYQPEDGKGECLFCRTAKFGGATECFDAADTFSTAALIAFIVLGALGIATSFRRQFEQGSDMLKGKLAGEENEKDNGPVYKAPAPAPSEFKVPAAIVAKAVPVTKAAPAPAPVTKAAPAQAKGKPGAKGKKGIPWNKPVNI